MVFGIEVLTQRQFRVRFTKIQRFAGRYNFKVELVQLQNVKILTNISYLGTLYCSLDTSTIFMWTYVKIKAY